MTILVFEDAQVEQLSPITTGRAACCVTVASYRLIDLLERLGQPLCGLMRAYLRDIQLADMPTVPPVDALASSQSAIAELGPRLAVNARLVPSATTLAALQDLLRQATDHETSGVVWEGNQLPPFSILLGVGRLWRSWQQHGKSVAGLHGLAASVGVTDTHVVSARSNRRQHASIR